MEQYLKIHGTQIMHMQLFGLAVAVKKSPGSAFSPSCLQ